MTRCTRCLGCAVWLAALPLVVWTPAALAQDVTRQACVSAYETNQKLRQEGKLTAARAELMICTQQTCPDFVRPDCIRWLSEVDAQMPTIVVAAKDADGRDTAAVVVYVDGRKAADQLDGRPIPLDPGPHRVRFEHAGSPPVDKQLLIQQGVKNRLIDVTFSASSATGPPPARFEGAPEPPPSDGDDGGGQSWQSVTSYVLFGLSVPAWVMFGVYGIQGTNRAEELQGLCPGPECTQEATDDAHQKLLIADVSLGIGAGLTALGVGFLVWHFVRDPEPDDGASVSFSGGPSEGGAMGQLTVRF